MIVYIGSGGVHAWMDREVRFGLERNTQDPHRFRLIPVLGEGANPAVLPALLKQQQYADLRDSARAPEEIARLVEVLCAPTGVPAVPPAYWITNSPFRGLRAFQPEDSLLFFGRDAESEQLTRRVAREPVLVVIGNSGSGKSSLVHAGLIPALRHGRFRQDRSATDSWRIAIVRPSALPFDELAEVMVRQLGAELSLKEQSDFIEDCRAKLPLGGRALRNALVALVGRAAGPSEHKLATQSGVFS